MSELFSKAQAAVDRVLIETLFGPGRWDGHDFHCRSPLRADSALGSFSIAEDGRWYDFATTEGGDFIDLFARFKGISLAEAARTLAGEPAPEQKPKREQIPPQIHSDPEAYEKIVRAVAGAQKVYESGRKSIAMEYGKPVLLNHYYNADGLAMFSVARYEKARGDGGADKTVRPYYYGSDGKIHTGCPWSQDKPLLGLLRLLAKPNLPVVIVEGEKCVEHAQRHLPDYVFVTWHGGAQAVSKTDWTPLQNRQVSIWPDNDAAGETAARSIQQYVPTASILPIPPGMAKGWDIADAIEDGTPIDAILRGETVEVPPGESPQKKKLKTPEYPYAPLGFDDTTYYFLSLQKKIIITIPIGKFNRSIILELGTLEQWALRGGMKAYVYDEETGYASKFTTKSGGLKIDAIQVQLMEDCNRVGRFDPASVRGVGVWRDEHGAIVVYDGQTLCTQEGKPVDLSGPRKYHYVSSSPHFESYFEDAATASEGQELVDLLDTLPFASTTEAVLAAGWALVSNFAGCLPWRPHIWVTGPSGAGKSTVVLNRLIKPLVGELHFTGSAETSKAATRRSLKNDCRPAIFDEFEPKDKRKLQNMQDILVLARNASSDASTASSIVDSDGTVATYYTRSCFCFSSINMPNEDQAITSRITPIEIKPVSTKKRQENKDRLLQLDKLMARKAAAFRRRIFRHISQILEDIEFLKNELRERVGNDRRIDQLAPMLATFYALTHDDVGDAKRDPMDLIAFAAKHITHMMSAIEDQPNDEDIVVERILSHIHTDITRDSVAMLIEETTADDPGDAHGQRLRAEHTLEKMGIRIIYGPGGYTDADYLAIRTNSPILTAIFSNTLYEKYDTQLRRNELCLNPRQVKRVRVDGQPVYVRAFKFSQFKERYLYEQDDPISDIPLADSA